PVRRDLRHVLVIARPHRLDRVASRIQRHELDRAADLHGRARGVRSVDAARLRGYRGDTVELRLRRRGRLLAARQREGEEDAANGHGVRSPPAGTVEGDAGGMPPGGITAHCTCSCIGYFTAASVAAAGSRTFAAPALLRSHAWIRRVGTGEEQKLTEGRAAPQLSSEFHRERAPPPASPQPPSATSNTIIIPASRCSATWQCSIQRPGLVSSSSSSAVVPTGSSTVSFHTRFSFGTPCTERTRQRWPWMWIGCCIACAA